VATGAATTVTVVDTDFEGSSTEVAVMVTVCPVAGAVQVDPTHVPAVAAQVTVFVTPPVTVVLKLVLVLTVRMGLTGLSAVRTTVWGITVAVAVAVAPSRFVTVRV